MLERSWGIETAILCCWYTKILGAFETSPLHSSHSCLGLVLGKEMGVGCYVTSRNHS